MTTLTQAMNDAGITTEIVMVPAPAKSDQWHRESYNYRVTFAIPGTLGMRDANTRTMVVAYATGAGWERYPSAAEVMRCVLSDARDVHPAYGEYRFEPWAENFGYDTDSRAAEAAFKATQEQAAELEELLTYRVLESWMGDEGISNPDDPSDAPTGRAIKRIPAKDRKPTRSYRPSYR